eukprot:TRINITY_DN17526_c0_g2_i1.p3 TRINITY_DN17526_c0_g2~~TRINITY_DN17526_c0_g2_i1.p3  ORF type:complete len:112 (-),score=38.54 TRINITY_DN17526_c0_g2_i1:51-386(-)
MKDFEKRESIEISYYKMEKDYEGRMMKLLMIDNEDRPNGKKFVPGEEAEDRSESRLESKRGKSPREKLSEDAKFSPSKRAESQASVSRSNKVSMHEAYNNCLLYTSPSPRD